MILLAIEDITRRKELETALRQRVEELAAADRSKNEFLALLAHELRNPLAPLRNAAHVLETAGADGAAVEQARNMMNRQIQNMTRLIEDLLDVSRITRGEVRLRRERVELATFLRHAVEIVQPLIGGTRPGAVALAAERAGLPRRGPHPAGPGLRQPAEQRLQVHPHGGHFWVTAELVTDGRETPGEVVVRVRDDGIGMAPETLPRVFDLFMQADRSYDRTRGGLGIGLTLVHRLVELHGGSVEAHSAGLGQGSELVVRLPILAPANRGSGSGAAAARSVSAAAAPPRRVLVVDDNVDSAESLALLLRLRGHEVEVAYDGPAALRNGRLVPSRRRPARHRPARAGRLSGRQPAAPPAADCQGAAPGLDRLRAERKTSAVSRQAGFDHHLTKPVDPQVIYDLLDRPRP